MKLIDIIRLYRAQAAFQRFASEQVKNATRGPFTPQEISEHRLREIYG